MIQDLGTVRPGTTLYIPFHTFDSNDPSASVTLSGLATSDIEIYKDGSTTQRASDAGYTLLDTDGIDFDGVTGIHGISISLADNTTAGFYAAGSQYWVVISSITVDAATVNFVLATFRIGYESAIINTTIATLSSQTSFTLTNGPAEDDALNGMWCIIHDVASAVQLGKALILDYTGSTKTVTLAAGTTFTAAATDNISIMDLAPLQPATTGRTAAIGTAGQIDANLTQSGGTNITSSGGRPEVNTTHAAGTAWGSGAITAASIAGDAITNAKIADNAIAVENIADNAITAAKIAADAIGASELAADAVTEIQSGLATAANLATVAGYLDTEIAAILADTNELQTDLADGGRIDLLVDAIKAKTDNLPSDPADASVIAGRFDTLDTNLATVDTVVDAILVDTAEIGAAGAGLTALASQASVDTIDNFLDTEIATIITKLTGLAPVSGTIGATGNTTTALHLSGLAYADDAINSMTLVIQDVSTGLYYSRWIEDWANTGDLATVATLPFTPEASVDLYWLLPYRADVTGGSGLDAAGVRAAIGMASANLDTQLGALPTAAENADAVWLEAIADHSGSAGSTAEALNAAGAAGDPWTTALPGAYGSGSAGNIIGNNLNATVSSRASQTSVDDLPTNAELATALGTADDAVLAAIAALNNLSQANIRTALGMASANLDTQLADLPTNSELTTALASADDAVLAAIAALNNLSQANVRTAVGLASANLDTQLSALATASALATVATYVDTEVAAIKAKTDNLPADPADASDIAASFSSIASSLTTLAAYVDTEVAAILAAVDTEVAAIKAKTDSLTFTVAGKVDANITHVNETAVTGTGESGDEWGPA